jgi:G3E family GTPase
LKENKKIPVYVISGFLGSGKTTILLKLIEEFRMRGLVPGIILNELGDINVESHLFAKENMVELLNGCICCSIQTDLKSTFDYFLNQSLEQVDILLIEGTGVANPLEIEHALQDPKYTDYLSLHSIIGVVDASNYLEYQSIFSSSSEIRSLLKQQITCSSIVILNKVDLVNQKKLKKIDEKLTRALNKDIPIYKTVFCDIPVDLLIDNNNLQEKSNIEIFSKNHNHQHEHHAHHDQIQAIRLKNIPMVDQRMFEDWLKGMPKNIVRGKGIVHIEGDGLFYNFQYSPNQLILNKIESDRNTETSLILIGYELDKKLIQNYWRKSLKKNEPE